MINKSFSQKETPLSEKNGHSVQNAEGWTLYPMDPAPVVDPSGHRPILSPTQEQMLDEVWDQAKSEYPGLFNGRVFVADAIGAEKISGHWDEYRRVLAQMRRPDMFRDRPLRQLAVCGLIRCADGIVMGRRRPGSLYLGGYWQMPPAGTVESRAGDDNVDLAAQILAEAEEELGLSREVLKVGDVMFAVEHAVTHIVDIALHLETHLCFADVEQAWRRTGNREYDRLDRILPDEMQKWKLRSDLVPTARFMLDAVSGEGLCADPDSPKNENCAKSQ